MTIFCVYVHVSVKDVECFKTQIVLNMVCIRLVLLQELSSVALEHTNTS